MAIVFNPACKWYSYKDVEKLIKQAIEETTIACLNRQIAELERLDLELKKLES